MRQYWAALAAVTVALLLGAGCGGGSGGSGDNGGNPPAGNNGQPTLQPVTVPGGGSVVEQRKFPVVTGVSPKEAPTTGGARITIKGRNFKVYDPGLQEVVIGRKVQSFTIIDDETVEAITAPFDGAAGSPSGTRYTVLATACSSVGCSIDSGPGDPATVTLIVP